MKLAFVLYKYFPYGGLQRNFLRIAKACHDRGHHITAYALSWQGEKPAWLDVSISPVKAMTGPRKYRKFAVWLGQQLRQNAVDAVVGFNKMPGLDVYYCADPCYENKARNLRSWWYKYTGRYRHFSRYEKAVFGIGQRPEILMFSDVQQALFQRYYDTEDKRINILPPGINRDRCAPGNADEIRSEFRREFNVSCDDLLLLLIGSGFRTKGLDRSLKALADMGDELKSRTKLFVIGQDDPGEFKLLARRLGVGDRITFFSGRDDVPRFLQGADLLVHPAYAENTGNVLLEAVVAGLPVLVTDVCGYARYVKEADAGEVLASPFSQEAFNTKLVEMLMADKQQWRENGIAFSRHADIYNMPLRAADIIEQALEKKREAAVA